ARPENVGPAAAARWRRLAVIDRQVPLHLGIGVQEPIQAEHNVVQRRPIDPFVLQIEEAIEDADLPGAPARRPVPYVEIAQRYDTAKSAGLQLIGLVFAR